MCLIAHANVGDGHVIHPGIDLSDQHDQHSICIFSMCPQVVLDDYWRPLVTPLLSFSFCLLMYSSPEGKRMNNGC